MNHSGDEMEPPVPPNKEETDLYPSDPESVTTLSEGSEDEHYATSTDSRGGSPVGDPPDEQAQVCVIQADVETEPRWTERVDNHSSQPVRQFLGNLIEKGGSRMCYVPITLEHQLTHDALVDPAAGITLMSPTVCRELQRLAQQSDQNVLLWPCTLDVQAYSTVGTRMTSVALVQLTIGPLTMVHPVYVSPLDSIPLLVGKDLLNRLEPLIDFKHLTIWAQVQQPLPITSLTIPVAQCYVMSIEDTKPPGQTNGQEPLPEMVREEGGWTQAPQTMQAPTDTLHQTDTLLTNALATDVALTSDPWESMEEWLPAVSLPTVCGPTCKQALTTHPSPAGIELTSATFKPAFSCPDALSLPSHDPVLTNRILPLKSNDENPSTGADLSTAPVLEPLLASSATLRPVDGLFVRASKGLTSPQLVVPQSQGGVRLTYAHDAPSAGHQGIKATYCSLRQVAYGPQFKRDEEQCTLGCLKRRQFDPG